MNKFGFSYQSTVRSNQPNLMKLGPLPFLGLETIPILRWRNSVPFQVQTSFNVMLLKFNYVQYPNLITSCWRNWFAWLQIVHLLDKFRNISKIFLYDFERNCSRVIPPKLLNDFLFLHRKLNTTKIFIRILSKLYLCQIIFRFIKQRFNHTPPLCSSILPPS